MTSKKQGIRRGPKARIKDEAAAEPRNKITVLMNAEEFERFDSYCEERGYKKSTLIARLIRDHLTSEGFRAQRELPLMGISRGHR